jgi:hypothetical protein
MRSIELTFDEPGDDAVRSAWRALVDVGLPSLGRHDAPSNRPHVTLAAGEALAVPQTLPTRPARVRLGGMLLFPAGPGRVVLVRAVVADAALVAFHRAVHELAPGAVPNTRPDRWSPHVTLARRLRVTDLPAAIDALAAVELPEELEIAGVRHWDGATTTVTAL